MVDSIRGVGVWRAHDEVDPALAVELERLGYRTLWLGASPGDLTIVDELLAATTKIVIATGIVNMWAVAAEPVAEAYHRIVNRHPGRFLLGCGIGHPEQTAHYRRPYATMIDYLDRLDAAGVPESDRVLAALGPRTLRLAAERAAGAHPYLVTPEHTRRARALIGPGALLAPEQAIVLDAGTAAQRLRRDTLAFYLTMGNYVGNLRTLGYTDDELAGSGSDRLIDALIPTGDPMGMAAALTTHLTAGADQVVLQLLTEEGSDPVPGYRALADALGLRPDRALAG